MKIRIKSPQDVVESQLDQLMILADRVWREQIEEAERAHATTSAAWRLESARLATLHGADSDRVKTASRLADVHDGARAEIGAERERLESPSPRPQAGSAVLHGRVVDARGVGIARLTLRIVDEAGKTMATTRTTPGGQYRVVLPLTDDVQVYVQIAGSGGKRVHEDDQPTHATPGGMLYREIVVDGAGARLCAAARRRATKRSTRRR
jgi:hypothetical protein